MKIIIAGAEKTGTNSITTAFELLGYNVAGFMEHFENWRIWKKILTTGGTTDDFYQLFKDVDAVNNIPASYFWDEILKAFPDAKVILTVRDSEDVWAKSMEKQLAQESQPIIRIMNLFSPSFRIFWKHFTMSQRAIYGTNVTFRWFKPTQHNMMLYRMAYRRVNSHVMQTAPQDKLLVYNVKEGWEPLCKFLGVEVPDQPFPLENVGGAVVDDDLQNRSYFKRCGYEMQFSLLLISLLSGFGIYKLIQSV